MVVVMKAGAESIIWAVVPKSDKAGAKVYGTHFRYLAGFFDEAAGSQSHEAIMKKEIIASLLQIYQYD